MAHANSPSGAAASASPSFSGYESPRLPPPAIFLSALSSPAPEGMEAKTTMRLRRIAHGSFALIKISSKLVGLPVSQTQMQVTQQAPAAPSSFYKFAIPAPLPPRNALAAPAPHSSPPPVSSTPAFSSAAAAAPSGPPAPTVHASIVWSDDDEDHEDQPDQEQEQREQEERDEQQDEQKYQHDDDDGDGSDEEHSQPKRNIQRDSHADRDDGNEDDEDEHDDDDDDRMNGSERLDADNGSSSDEGMLDDDAPEDEDADVGGTSYSETRGLVMNNDTRAVRAAMAQPINKSGIRTFALYLDRVRPGVRLQDLTAEELVNMVPDWIRTARMQNGGVYRADTFKCHVNCVQRVIRLFQPQEVWSQIHLLREPRIAEAMLQMRRKWKNTSGEPASTRKREKRQRGEDGADGSDGDQGSSAPSSPRHQGEGEYQRQFLTTKKDRSGSNKLFTAAQEAALFASVSPDTPDGLLKLAFLLVERYFGVAYMEEHRALRVRDFAIGEKMVHVKYQEGWKEGDPAADDQPTERPQEKRAPGSEDAAAPSADGETPPEAAKLTVEADGDVAMTDAAATPAAALVPAAPAASAADAADIPMVAAESTSAAPSAEAPLSLSSSSSPTTPLSPLHPFTVVSPSSASLGRLTRFVLFLPPKFSSTTPRRPPAVMWERPWEGERCPVRVWTKFMEKRPPIAEMGKSGEDAMALWLQTRRRSSGESSIWYAPIPLGRHKISSFIQTLCQQAGLTSVDGCTNSSVRFRRQWMFTPDHPKEIGQLVNANEHERWGIPKGELEGYGAQPNYHPTPTAKQRQYGSTVGTPQQQQERAQFVRDRAGRFGSKVNTAGTGAATSQEQQHHHPQRSQAPQHPSMSQFHQSTGAPLSQLSALLPQLLPYLLRQQYPAFAQQQSNFRLPTAEETDERKQEEQAWRELREKVDRRRLEEQKTLLSGSLPADLPPLITAAEVKGIASALEQPAIAPMEDVDMHAAAPSPTNLKSTGNLLQFLSEMDGEIRTLTTYAATCQRRLDSFRSLASTIALDSQREVKLAQQQAKIAEQFAIIEEQKYELEQLRKQKRDDAKEDGVGARTGNLLQQLQSIGAEPAAPSATMMDTTGPAAGSFVQPSRPEESESKEPHTSAHPHTVNKRPVVSRFHDEKAKLIV
jgi:hypothetical protein